MRSSLVYEPKQWNEIHASIPGAHLLQSWEWGQLKHLYGWHPTHLTWRDDQGRPKAAAQILQRTLPIPGFHNRISILYCPRGPTLDWSDCECRQQVITDLEALSKERRAIFLKIDPQLPIGYGRPDDAEAVEDRLGCEVHHHLQAEGWRESAEQIQFRNTLTLDVTRSEDELLAEMKQKTRYNIRLATRRGVHVYRGRMEDLDLLYRMYAETSIRDGFVIRNPEYYQDAWGSFIQAGLAQPFIALVDDSPVAALIVFRYGDSATYMYGMSTNTHREKMPNHLLQWEAIRWSKEQGCLQYDFWGAPDHLDEEDPMWGVYKFKRGFGAQLVRTIGAWDHPTRPGLYWLYANLIPRILDILRFRGRARTRRHLS